MGMTNPITTPCTNPESAYWTKGCFRSTNGGIYWNAHPTGGSAGSASSTPVVRSPAKEARPMTTP